MHCYPSHGIHRGSQESQPRTGKISGRPLLLTGDHPSRSLCGRCSHPRKDIILCCLDFKGAFPSTDHRQLVKVLEFIGLFHDFTRLLSNLYRKASTEFVTPYGHTPAMSIRRGNLQGDPPAPILLDRMIEPRIRWLRASNKGCDMASCGL